MEKLPYELLSCIFADLTQEDIINLPSLIARKGLTEEELSSKFGIIDVWIDEQSLRTLIRAVLHPLFGNHIQILCFHTDQLARISFRQFYNHYRRDFGEDVERAQRKTKEDYCHYGQLYEAQQHFKAEQRDFGLLIKALQSLRCHPSIIINNHYGSPSQYPATLGDSWDRNCGRSYNFRARSYVFDLLIQSLGKCKMAVSELGIQNTAPLYLHTLSTPVKSGSLTKGSNDIWRLLGKVKLHYTPQNNFPGRYPLLPGIFCHLRKFNLGSEYDFVTDHQVKEHSSKISAYKIERDYYDTSRSHLNSTLNYILSECEMLQDLEISFFDEIRLGKEPGDMPYLPLTSLLNKPCRRAPLQNLKISNCKITEPELVTFLLRYPETLKTLHFKDLYLTQGTRLSVFEQLGGEMSLTSAVFDGFHHGLLREEYYDLILQQPRDLPFPYKPDEKATLAWLCG